MPTPAELEAKLWEGLRSDMTLMLGRDGTDAPARPMTAMFEGEADQGPLWFFTSHDSELVKAGDGAATAVFVAKGHDLFARIHGSLAEATSPEMIEKLWNPFIAAWYDGKDDPNLVLLRLDATQAEVWLNENNLLAGVKMLLGVDPKKDYSDKVANVDLR